MNTNLYYSLMQIASWTSDNTEVTIPALQRGLVWKPAQVELLWDSILRGFPIGSFLLSDIVEKDKKGKYYLMDGQQRYNAISIGFNKVQNPRAVLWIDLEPPKVEKSTRKYWIKATTIPHPWGFKNDDDCSRLNTAEKRNALEEFNLQGNIYNEEFSLSSTWPVEANCPIPLWCLLKSSLETNNSDSFLQEALELFQGTDFVYREKISLSDTAEKYVKKDLFKAFSALKEYRINCNHLPKDVMESETLANVGEQTTLEVLFTRLNTGGTQISIDDLNYSAIKAYWPSIKEVNDQLAEKYMSPSKLVMLAFRLALTGEEDNSLKNELSIKQIRNLANKESERNKIVHLYNSNLESILKQIDKWLGVSDDGELRTPNILRTIIANNSPDVYLLLMYFAFEDISKPIELTASQIKALAFSLHWFTTNNDKKGCVQEIFKKCKEGINLNNIQKGIAKLMHDNKFMYIYTPSELEGLIKIGKEANWRVRDVVPAPAKDFFDRIFWNGNKVAQELLLFAERQYINSHFSNYDPAKQDMWAEYNRPWDFDHIVARNRIDRKQGRYREYDKIWLDSIGNFAAISYESNRSKNDGEDYSEYHDNLEALDFDANIEKLPYEVTHDSEASLKFAQITYNRFCRIYCKAYEMIGELFEQTILSDTLQERKELFMEIKKQFPDAVIHFAASDGNDYLLTREREQDWSREWLGVGIVIKDYMVCLEWPAIVNDNNIPQNVEIGIRKALGTNVIKENMKNLLGDEMSEDSLNPWWYIKEDSNTINLNYIVERLNYYLEKCNKE